MTRTQTSLLFSAVLTAQSCGISLRRLKLPAMLAGLNLADFVVWLVMVIEALNKVVTKYHALRPWSLPCMSRQRHTRSRDPNTNPPSPSIPDTHFNPFKSTRPPGPRPQYPGGSPPP